jgi:hypothetical protein
MSDLPALVVQVVEGLAGKQMHFDTETSKSGKK